jgi:UTP--glucose-1-phosphate uridylyltransferase
VIVVKNGEIQITDALMTLAKMGKVIAYQFQGRRFDCGSVKGFVEAVLVFAIILCFCKII